MFGQITERFESIFRSVRGLGKITDKNINDTAREIRRALLDADVNFSVAKSFVKTVQEKAQGTKVLKSIKPGQQFVKIVQDEMVALLGEKVEDLELTSKPSIILLAGLQGAGKTTSAGKLANRLKKSGKSVLMVAADVYRPAAVQQLIMVGKQAEVPVYEEGTGDPLAICKRGIEKARSLKNDVVILDTAGRLHLDGEMMTEIQSISDAVNPDEILFVADGMTGQDAVKSAQAFHEALPLTGVILTKMDGDARGGAAVSIREVTGKPIKFIGTSEKLDGLDVFDPKRIADRILGFGDVVSIVEKAQQVFDEDQSKDFQKKLAKNTFDLDDFKTQLQQMKKMGSMSQLISMMPGMNSKALKQLNMDDRQVGWTEAIINSMTLTERQQPQIINGSRRLRISKGCGRSVQEINALLKQFSQMKKMMKKMGKMKNMKLPGMGNFKDFN
ncbi:MAG: signal recognition particle protein [Candidatus Marinimicrobia bacterium]|jgi:signal recognition particle subunit SRP54|nr:signal recognition particle protein [Candidatus Neomarinimicrobiota bacterium]MBT4752307.1 signal recognition particle protein [Candidatus Neomarinimicrobiota bacterium]MBT5114812.1 signal recognition particle protein [Candidatus Neomarinimicrobiota bacterium]MBT5748521.1 signal recognition particle protein [Candidatus Neomarinimicrobiota bacterium]MBT6796303.1 signal recognition particle protein [Candidatus Neomarinimicrobiota bacterium]